MFEYNVQQKCFSGEKVLELSVSPSSRAWKIYSYFWCCLSCRLLVWFVLKDWVVLDAEKAYEKYPSDLLCIGLYCTVSVTIQHFVLRGYDFILLPYWFFFLFSYLLKIVCVSKLILLPPFPWPAGSLTLLESHQRLSYCCSCVLFMLASRQSWTNGGSD